MGGITICKIGKGLFPHIRDKDAFIELLKEIFGANHVWTNCNVSAKDGILTIKTDVFKSKLTVNDNWGTISVTYDTQVNNTEVALKSSIRALIDSRIKDILRTIAVLWNYQIPK